ncbi:MAG: enoyl-CoA hydratase, partial [Lachnospiraceae bacterium]|nr:enoyl-CoA hydratase [Lachnospiraceae bacterium]
MGFVNYEVDGMVGLITINRPEALNALNSQVLT